MDLSRKCDSQVPSGCRSGLKIGVELDLLAGEDVVRFDGQVAAVGDFVDVDQEGVAGEEAFEGGFAAEAGDGEVGVAIDGSDAGVSNVRGGPLVVDVESCQGEMVAAGHAGFLEAGGRPVLAARGVVGDHEADMILRRGLLPGDAVHAVRIQEVPLVG